MSIVLYYLEPDGPGNWYPLAEYFGSTDLLAVLSRAEELRKTGRQHVSISSEMDGSVGKPGVTSIVDGKTPDGHDYDWKKRR